MPITSETLAQFLNPALVETGTFLGDGTQAALDAGFEHVYSIELYPALHANALHRFAGEPRVTLFGGPSVQWLPEVLAKLSAPATFWLDSHYCGGPTAGAWACPLLHELDLIARHPIKTHTILIDDRHLFGLDVPSETAIRALLQTVNPDYHIQLLPSAATELGLDILAASVS